MITNVKTTLTDHPNYCGGALHIRPCICGVDKTGHVLKVECDNCAGEIPPAETASQASAVLVLDIIIDLCAKCRPVVSYSDEQKLMDKVKRRALGLPPRPEASAS